MQLSTNTPHSEDGKRAVQAFALDLLSILDQRQQSIKGDITHPSEYGRGRETLNEKWLRKKIFDLLRKHGVEVIEDGKV